MTPLVLVVDDDESIRSIVEVALQLYTPWLVETVDGGDEAVERVRQGDVDLVLLDLMMPGKDGLSTFAELQDDPRTQDVPVILLTAKAQIGPVQVWDDLAVRGVIAKPFSVRHLGPEIARMLGWELPDSDS